MKYWVIGILVILLLAPFAGSVSAHGTGLPPFFKINGVFSPTYPPTSARVGSSLINLPQDIAPQNYLINQPLYFSIDTSLLATVIPQSVLNQTVYSWDFGDGGSGSGTDNTHSYKKIGSYVLSVTANYNQPDIPPQLIESVLINILPNSSYKLPQAILKVDGSVPQEGTSSASLELDLRNSVDFDARSSGNGSAPIVRYSIDFNDGQSSDQPEVSHQYQLPQYFASVILRVTDKNGFYSDTSVNIRDISSQVASSPLANNLPKIIVGGVAVIILVSLGLILHSKLKKTV